MILYSAADELKQQAAGCVAGITRSGAAGKRLRSDDNAAIRPVRKSP
jgi:hypothetical protein